MPVNNITDAKIIASTYGIATFHVQGVLVIGATDNIDELVFQGQNELVDTIVLVSGCSTINTVFRSMRLTGALGGGVFCDRCGISALTNIGSNTEPSLFNECVLIEGTHSLRSGLITPENIQIVNSFSGISTGTGVVFDLNGSNSRVAFRRYSGVIDLINCTSAAETVEIEMDQGEVTIAASCTAGSIAVRGIAKLVDNSAGTTVDSTGLAQYLTWEEAISAHTITGSSGSIMSQILSLAQAILGLQ